jgi:hypothetical protein
MASKESLVPSPSNNIRQSCSYDRVLAIYNQQGETYGTDSTIQARANRVSIGLKDSNSFLQAVDSVDSETFNRMAGSDLANIFMPFQTKVGMSGVMPGFITGLSTTATLPSGNTVNFHHVLPFYWNASDTTHLQDRFYAPSGDSLRGIISSDTHYQGVDGYRDVSNMRSIGLRLPLVGVGWGFTLDDNNPFPSGSNPNPALYPSGTKFFKGGLTKGWQLDPSDYIAAPIDFRYDTNRNVWTCGGAGLPAGSGIYKTLQLIDNLNPGTAAFDYPRFS